MAAMKSKLRARPNNGTSAGSLARVDVVLLNTFASMRPSPFGCPHITLARHQGESWLRWAQRVQAPGRSGGQLWRFRGNMMSDILKKRGEPPEIPMVLPMVVHLNDPTAFQMRLL
jgi:hypothetical protein